ncbi:hypothetical protein B0H14DRAFT_2513953 [Mycena olivaceomarginata]|nr:hypothetical protein B0H14DRAFT_2513953 [Mycena olivaceomarginata]
MSALRTFQHQRIASLGSCLWSIWLYVPSSWRGRVYRTFLRFLAHHIPLSNAYRLPGFYIKLCDSPDEALATEYVRIHTSIPVPKVLDVVQIPAGSVHICKTWLMISTVLPGTPLFYAGSGHRLRGASEHQVQRVCECLRDWIAQLRNLPSPFDQRVCGFTGGSFLSRRIDENPVGPFTCIADLHAHESLTLSPSELASNPHLAHLVSTREKKSYSIHLVHGDLLLHNILADSDLQPTGIVDWECAAWMPEYWETMSSSRGSFAYMWRWKDIRRESFPAYEAELELDREVQKSHGE